MLNRLLLGVLALALAPLAAWGAQAAGGSTPLDRYLDNLKTLRATFLQVLVDAHGKEIDRSTGTIVVVRPGKLRWEIHPARAGDDDAGTGAAGTGTAKAGGATNTAASAGADSGGQLLVADGRNLWFLDRDLQQVTVKPVDSALSATPAMLLSGTVDVRKNFTISPAGKRDGLEWVLVEPRGTEADFRRALFGFDGGELKRMILDDKLGQTATIAFQMIERNGSVSPDEVSFTPPPGVDVIGTPRK
jgi:outer membrane lipoprotein carrier protein